jgi:hypothetical protein
MMAFVYSSKHMLNLSILNTQPWTFLNQCINYGFINKFFGLCSRCYETQRNKKKFNHTVL